ncbi:MAG TPA: hypothetical protein VM537_05085 [Anaerolineae bacterium]|nr:hypothetical protein [Anaerolineae bacterium]
MAQMKIVEALKRLRIIEKKIAANNTETTAYASGLSTRKPLFESENRQETEVKSITQSSVDLIKEYLRLKRLLDVTNLAVTVEINGETRPIAEWLIVKRKVADMAISIYNALNDSAASGARREDRMYESSGKSPQIVRYYKEEERLKHLRHWQDLREAIDGRLEVVNATTDLAEEG